MGTFTERNQMNILFYHANAIQPTKGGISKITYVLGELFQGHGHIVHYVSAKPHPKEDCLKNQHFLVPERKEESLLEIIRNNKIDIIINQFNFQAETVDMIYNCKQKCKDLKVISCYHNSILTPIYNIAYQRELSLKAKHLGFLFHILTLPVVNRAIMWYYIRKYRTAYLRVFNKSDNIVLLCEGQKDEFLKMCGMDDTHKAEVIYNTYFNDNEIIDFSNKQKNVLWVGTFDYMVKRPDYILRAWREIQKVHKDWSLYMLGDGPSLSYMKNLSEQLDLKNVFFTGRVQSDEYYKTASIHCITSTHECFPMVVLEAKANGCPSIICNCFTSAEVLVQDKINGILVQPFSVRSLVDKLIEIMDNEEALSNMQHNAIRDIERFDKEHIYSKWNTLFQKL